MTHFDQINAMSAQALADALSGDPADRLALLRTAAEGGAVEAQLLVGQLLLDGRDAPADPGEALRFFSMAATAGHPMGMNMVGRCLEHGWGTRSDKGQAARWYEAAALRKLDWGLYNLATLLALGDGVPRDRERALALFRQAAAMGHGKSMTMVGSFYEDGWVVSADRAIAGDWYRRGAEAGDFRGQFNHGRLLADAGSLDEAVRWLRRVPESATPRFLGLVRDWLHARAEPVLRQLAVDL